MDLAAALLKLFGLATHWVLRLRGYAFLLSLPLIVTTVIDWRVRRRS